MIASTSILSAVELLSRRGTPVTILNITKHLQADAREVKTGLLALKRDELVVDRRVGGLRVWERKS